MVATEVFDRRMRLVAYPSRATAVLLVSNIEVINATASGDGSEKGNGEGMRRVPKMASPEEEQKRSGRVQGRASYGNPNFLCEKTKPSSEHPA